MSRESAGDELYPMTIHYDGDCSICRYDVSRMRMSDHGGRLRFVDICSADFDGAAFARRHGLAEGEVDSTIRAALHAVLADGTLVTGMETFRRVLVATGHRRLAAFLAWPGIRRLGDSGYRLFARYRVRLSRRFGGIFAALTPPECDDGSCRVG